MPRDHIMKATRMGKLMVDCCRKRKHKVFMKFPRKIHPKTNPKRVKTFVIM